MRRTLLSLVAILPLAFGACSTRVEAGPAAMKALESGFTEIQAMITKVTDADTAKALADKVTAVVPGLKTALTTIKALDLTKLTDALKGQQTKVMDLMKTTGDSLMAKATEFAGKPDIAGHLQKAVDAFKQLTGM